VLYTRVLDYSNPKLDSCDFRKIWKIGSKKLDTCNQVCVCVLDTFEKWGYNNTVFATVIGVMNFRKREFKKTGGGEFST